MMMMVKHWRDKAATRPHLTSLAKTKAPEATQPGICLGDALLMLEGPKFEAEGCERGRGS